MESGETLVLTPDDEAVLGALLDSRTTMKQADLAAAAERDIKTVRKGLRVLEKAGLLMRPRGVRSGYAITDAGRTYLSEGG